MTNNEGKKNPQNEVLTWENFITNPLETITALPGVLFKAFTDTFQQERGEEAREVVVAGAREEVVAVAREGVVAREEVGAERKLGGSNTPENPQPTKQQKIKEQLQEKIKQDEPTGTDATPQKILEHKVKNLSIIFFELRYKKIDDLLNNEELSNEDKIKQIQDFQKQFTLDLPIRDQKELDHALDHLSLDIGTNSLEISDDALTNPKFTPASYDKNSLQSYLIHSRLYFEGILKDSGIDATSRIEASKSFVAHLEFVSKSDINKDSEEASAHRKFVEFQKDAISNNITELTYEDSTCNCRDIILNGIEFAKSVAVKNQNTEPKSEYKKPLESEYFYESVVKPEVEVRELLMSNFKKRLNKMQSLADDPNSQIDLHSFKKIMDDTGSRVKIFHGRDGKCKLKPSTLTTTPQTSPNKGVS